MPTCDLYFRTATILSLSPATTSVKQASSTNEAYKHMTASKVLTKHTRTLHLKLSRMATITTGGCCCLLGQHLGQAHTRLTDRSRRAPLHAERPRPACASLSSTRAAAHVRIDE